MNICQSCNQLNCLLFTSTPLRPATQSPFTSDQPSISNVFRSFFRPTWRKRRARHVTKARRPALLAARPTAFKLDASLQCRLASFRYAAIRSTQLQWLPAHWNRRIEQLSRQFFPLANFRRRIAIACGSSPANYRSPTCASARATRSHEKRNSAIVVTGRRPIFCQDPRSATNAAQHHELVSSSHRTLASELLQD